MKRIGEYILSFLFSLLITLIYCVFIEKLVNYNYSKHSNKKLIIMSKFGISFIFLILFLFIAKLDVISKDYKSIQYGIIFGSIIQISNVVFFGWKNFNNEEKLFITSSILVSLIFYLIYYNHYSKKNKMEIKKIKKRVIQLVNKGKIKYDEELFK